MSFFLNPSFLPRFVLMPSQTHYSKLFLTGLFRALLLTGLIIGARSTVSACSCVVSDVVAKAVKDADFVAVGTAKMAKPFSASIKSGWKEMSLLSYTFEIEKVYKGKRSKKIVQIVTDVGSDGDCGYPFTVGKKYIIYAKCPIYIKHSESVNKKISLLPFLYTSICTRTRAIEEEEIRLLKQKE